MLYKQTGGTDSRYAGRQRGNLEQAGCSGYPRREVQGSSAIPVHSRLPAEGSWTPAWESRAVANLPDDDRMYVKSTSHWPPEVTVPIARPTPPFRHSCFRYLLLPAIPESALTGHAGTRAAGTRTCRCNADKPHAANRQERAGTGTGRSRGLGHSDSSPHPSTSSLQLAVSLQPPHVRLADLQPVEPAKYSPMPFGAGFVNTISFGCCNLSDTVLGV